MANGVYVLENILLCRNDDGNGKQYSVNGLEYKRRQCSMHTHLCGIGFIRKYFDKWVIFVYYPIYE